MASPARASPATLLDLAAVLPRRVVERSSTKPNCCNCSTHAIDDVLDRTHGHRGQRPAPLNPQ